MAGGSAINVFKFNTGGLPKETLNAKLWFAVFAFGLMGAARGVDEGLITGVFNSHAFKKSIGIDDLGASELASIKGTISSMVQLGSVAGALLYVPFQCPSYCCDHHLILTTSQCICRLRSYRPCLGNSPALRLLDCRYRHFHWKQW